jgi:hypothetical protein
VFRRSGRGAASPSIDALVDEGMLVIGAALRLGAKNRLILRSLRDGAGYDEQELRQMFRAHMFALIEEKEEEHRRLAEEIPRARRLLGKPLSADDYRRVDVPVLELRQEVSEGLVDRLRASADDGDFLTRQLELARESALDEIVHPRLARMHVPLDERYESERAARMELVRADLLRLLADSGSGG